MREALDSLNDALRDLGLEGLDVATLADHPGRRVVVRAGDFVVKAFTERERDAWSPDLLTYSGGHPS